MPRTKDIANLTHPVKTETSEGERNAPAFLSPSDVANPLTLRVPHNGVGRLTMSSVRDIHIVTLKSKHIPQCEIYTTLTFVVHQHILATLSEHLSEFLA